MALVYEAAELESVVAVCEKHLQSIFEPRIRQVRETHQNRIAEIELHINKRLMNFTPDFR